MLFSLSAAACRFWRHQFPALRSGKETARQICRQSFCSNLPNVYRQHTAPSKAAMAKESRSFPWYSAKESRKNPTAGTSQSSTSSTPCHSLQAGHRSPFNTPAQIPTKTPYRKKRASKVTCNGRSVIK